MTTNIIHTNKMFLLSDETTTGWQMDWAKKLKLEHIKLKNG